MTALALWLNVVWIGKAVPAISVQTTRCRPLQTSSSYAQGMSVIQQTDPMMRSHAVTTDSHVNTTVVLSRKCQQTTKEDCCVLVPSATMQMHLLVARTEVLAVFIIVQQRQ
jgi:hypothetical protein